MVKILGLPDAMAADYIKLLSRIESNDNPNAKAKTSTASGRFQFIKSTWTGLGYDWKDVFNDQLQYQAAERFTNDNARGLRNAGCAINFATLYGAHFLGLSGFLKIMRATPTTPIENVTTAAQRKANPSILKGTVADFTAWLAKKTGHDYRSQYAAPTPGPVIVEPAAEVEAKFNPLPLIIALVAVIGLIIYLVTKG